MSTVIWMVCALIIFLALWVGVPLYLSRAFWQPTENHIVARMLSMAYLRPGERLYDLGSGDGRIVIAAAREFGAIATGVEINPFLYALSSLRVILAGLWGGARIVFGNFYNADLRDADVVTLFLSQHANDRLNEKLRRELKPGARVVSYVWEMKGWKLVRYDVRYQIYAYER
ncbi:MAG: SAM-dependent methyltransferase [bacterium]